MKKTGIILLLFVFASMCATAALVSQSGKGSSSTAKMVSDAAAPVDAHGFIASGKASLQNHNILAARDAFKRAVASDSTNQEAQFLYGVTRILALYEDGQATASPGIDSIREILELSGLSFTSFGLYNTQMDTSQKRPGIANTTPSTGMVIAYLSSTVLPEINGAIANFDAVTNPSFTSSISPAAIGNSITNYLSVDYGDVSVIKAMMHLVACNLQLLGVYGLDFNPPQILSGDPKQVKLYYDLLLGSNTLLTPQNPAKLSTAKTELLSFIDIFNQSVAQIKSRTALGGHLFVLDQPLNDTPMGATSYELTQIQNALADIKASLAGPTFSSYAGNTIVDLSKFFNSAAPVNLRTLAVDCGSGSVLSDRTLGGVLPIGLGRLEQTVLLHAREIRGGACAGSEMPRISVSPDSAYFYSSAPVLVTISNLGTANLAVSSIALKGDAAADYKITAGTCPSLAPTLAPGNSCTMITSYRPISGTGNGRAYIDIAGNDPLAPHSYIPLTGNATSIPMSYQLNVAVNGTGSGVVTSAQPVLPISCPTVNCSVTVPYNFTNQRLIGTPGSSSTLSGWTGCDNLEGDDCVVNMISNRLVTATFALDTRALVLNAYPAAASYPAPREISLIANKVVDIYYTLDGTTPTLTSLRYNGPITLPAGATTTINYLAKDADGLSPVKSATYVVGPTDTQKPIITGFAASRASGGKIVITKFSATDNVNVKNYCVTSINDPVSCYWNNAVPDKYNGISSTTLYAFAKDEADNISTGYRYDINPSVTLAYGLVYHHLRSDGVEYDSLDVGVNSTAATLAAAGIASLTITGPDNFLYTVTDEDKSSSFNNQLAFFKPIAATVANPQSLLKPGVYTTTLTDTQGHTSYRMSTYVTPTRTLPLVDITTIMMQRKTGTDNSYRISWAPVNDTQTYYYRLRIALNDSANTPVYNSTRDMITYADVPAGIMTDGVDYVVRVEVSNTGPSIDLMTNRTYSGWVPFKPQATDYNAGRVLVNNANVFNRATGSSTFVTQAVLNVNNYAAVTMLELIGPDNSVVYTYNLSTDVSKYTGNLSGSPVVITTDFFKEFATPLAPGAYRYHFVANGIDQYAYATLTTPVAYPSTDQTTWQVEDLGNVNNRFSWANVDHTGVLYYRVAIKDTVTGIYYYSMRTNQAFADIPKANLGTNPLQWRVEVFDSPITNTVHNRTSGSFIDVSPIAYDAARPVINSFRIRNNTTSDGSTYSRVSVNATSPQGTLAQILVTGPGGYSRDLLTQGRWSNMYGEFALEEQGAPASGLYTITVKDANGKSAVRYKFQPASHPVPPVDFRTFHTNLETNGDVRLSWAPVVSDVPLWYQLELYGQYDLNGDGQLDRVYPVGSFSPYQQASTVIPAATLATLTMPTIGVVRVSDDANFSVVNNTSSSVMVGNDVVGRDFSTLTDSDGDGFASNVDLSDANPASYPFSDSGAMPLSMTSRSPQSIGNAISSTITVTFNKPIKQNTLPGNFTLYNITLNTAVTGSVSYSPSSRIATFTPSVPLSANSAYSVTVTSGVKDESGNGMAPYSWNFTTTGLSTLPTGTVIYPPPVTLAQGGVYHRTNGNGTRVDVLDATIRMTTTTLAGINLNVTGPNGFSPYTFTDADINPMLNGQTSLYHEFPVNSLPNGVYTFTMTDANGNVSYRVANNVPIATLLPQVDKNTLQIQRKTGTDNSYRFSWAPVNDTRPVYYRISVWLNGAFFYSSTRNMMTYADVPAKIFTDGTTYNVRVEAFDAPTVDVMAIRTNTAYVDFTPQAADYNANRLLTNYAILLNRTESNGATTTEANLSVNTPAAVSAVDLRDSAGTVIYTFDIGTDRSSQEFYKKFTTPLAPGSYTIHFVANGLDHYGYATLTAPVTYPKPDTTTLQAEDQGNGYIRFSWANVNYTGPIYYRVYVYDKITGPGTNSPVVSTSRQNVAYVDIAKATLGDLATKQWRVEVFDNNHVTTHHNRRSGDFIDLNPAPYNAGKPVISSWRIRSLTSPSAITTSIITVNASAPQGALAEIRVTGPNGYSRDLLSLGRWSNFYTYVLEESGVPAVGLYTFTVRDTSGRSTTRYFYQPAAHPLPPVDYRTFRTNVEPDGSMRLSWAPVSSDIPVWYAANFFSSTDLSVSSQGYGDGLIDSVYTAYGYVDINNDGTSEQVTVYPLTSVTIPATQFATLSAPPLFWITAQDAGMGMPTLTGAPVQTSDVVHNFSHSVMVKKENTGFNYASLVDADGDGYASNSDSNDANSAIYPFFSNNDVQELKVVSQSPYPGSTGFTANSSICAYFNKGIDQRTLPGNFALSNGADGYYTYNASSRMACFKPSAPLPENSTLAVIVGSGVKDLAGNGMSSAATWNFTTAGTPVSSASPPGGTYASAQSVTLTANSPGAVIYYTTDGTTPVKLSASGTTKTYSGPILLATAATTTLKYFAVDASGISEAVNTQTYIITAPAAPTGLKVGANSDHTALSWNPVDGAQSYNVYLAGVAAPSIATGTALRDALSTGFYTLRSYNYMSGPVTKNGFDTNLLTLTGDGAALNEAYTRFWDYSTMSWTSTSPPDFATQPVSNHYMLTSGGWVQGSDTPSNLTVAMNSDGSATLTNKTDQTQQKLTIGIVDLAGAPIGSSVEKYLPIASGAPVFPSGSQRYDKTFTQLSDSYWTNNAYIIPPTVATIDDIPAAYMSTNTPLYLESASGQPFHYNLYFSSGNAVAISQYNFTTNTTSTIGFGTWDIRTVYGQRILAITLPPTLRSVLKLAPDPFFAVVNGTITSGWHGVAGQPNYANNADYSFNSTAIDHIQAHFQTSAGGGGSPGGSSLQYTQLASTTDTAYTHSGLALNTSYTYAVSATGSTGESAPSTQVSGTTSVAPVTTAAPAGGLFNGTQNVTLTGSVSGSKIYFTTDGSTPLPGSASTKTYSGPITVSATTTLKYFAINLYGVSETVNTQTYIISPVPITTALPSGGTFPIGQTVSVTLTSSVPTATIYYTINGTIPDSSDSTGNTKIYSGAIVLPAATTTTLRYFAKDSATGTSEAVKSQTYTILVAPPIPVVTASPLGGLYNSNQTITLVSSLLADIYYTTNGAAPDASSNRYTGPITISSTTTLKYFAISKENAIGTVRSQTYSIDTVVPETTASPVGGTFSSPQKITLATSKAAAIYYTTDGSIPIWPATGATQTYVGPVPITSSGIVRYFSRDAAGNVEALKSQTYIINPAALVTTATPQGGLFNAAQAVTLSTGVYGAVISYTTDGSNPASSATAKSFSSPVEITATTTLKYYARDTSGTSEPVKSQTYAIDPVPPTVTSVLPINNATGVALDTAIVITFSKRIAAETLPAAGRILGVTASGSLSADGTVWTIIPSAPLSYATAYGYNLTGVKDPYGNALPAVVTTFTTMAKPVKTVVSTLSLSISANAIISGNPVAANGLLTSSGSSTVGQPVNVTITSPDGGVATLSLTSDANGAFSSDIPATMIQQPGRYQLQGFAGGVDGSLAPVSSQTTTLRVLPVAGYAVMIVGRIPSGEGVASHAKTFNRAMNALSARGFTDDNIKVVRADVNASHIQDVEDAITSWAKDKLNQQPAPLQIILIDHGDQEKFYMEDKILSSTQLADWLNRLEQGLNPAALAQTRYIIIGSCDSGSYINEIAASGRIIITSADVNEQSFRGPNEPDGIRSGEYFLDVFYKYLRQGKSVRDSFNDAAADIAVYTRRGGVVSANGDKPLQNPRVSINGDTVGIYQIPAGTEDNAPDTLYMGTGENIAFDPTGMLPIEPNASVTSIFLDAGKTSAVISVAGTPGQNAWFEVRAPSAIPKAGGDQLIIDLPTVTMTFDSATSSYKGTYANFTESGNYEIGIHIQEPVSGDMSNSHLTLYRNRAGNRAPNAFALTSPPSESTQKTTLSFEWAMATDPDNDQVSYTLLVSRNEGMSNPSIVKEGLLDQFAIITYDDGLLDLARYYWQVWAVDSYGVITKSSVSKFDTDNTNGGVSLVTGKVTDSTTGAGIAGATVSIYAKQATTLSTGSYLTTVSPGSFTLSASATGYNSAEYPGLIGLAMLITSKNIALTPVAQTTFKISAVTGQGNGYIDCPLTVGSGKQGSCTIQPGAGFALKSVTGCNGTQNGTVYTTGAITADCTVTATFSPLQASKPGDCDNSGTVTIAEVQSAINMFLGLKTVDVCVDVDSSNSVSIAEVQKVINSFLGL